MSSAAATTKGGNSAKNHHHHHGGGGGGGINDSESLRSLVRDLENELREKTAEAACFEAEARYSEYIFSTTEYFPIV